MSSYALQKILQSLGCTITQHTSTSFVGVCNPVNNKWTSFQNSGNLPPEQVKLIIQVFSRWNCTQNSVDCTPKLDNLGSTSADYMHTYDAAEAYFQSWLCKYAWQSRQGRVSLGA